MSASLPEFPWDTLADAKALAGAHPDGIVDLSVGTPVDPVAPLIQEALAAASFRAGISRNRRHCASFVNRRWPRWTAVSESPG